MEMGMIVLMAPQRVVGVEEQRMNTDRQTSESVLIVEDDPDVRETLSEILDEEGYRVECAADGREALEHLRNGPRPKLILLDLMLPGMDGWEFRRRQRQDPALASIPVAVLSGIGDMGLHADYLDAVEYFPKPFDLQALITSVGHYCRTKTHRTSGEASAAGPF